MSQVYPFRAFRYNPAVVPFDRVLTQPYDKISPEAQEKYYAADPHNLIAVEKGRTFLDDSPQNNVYTRAAAAVQDWIAKNVLTQDPAPAFYGYTQEYTAPGASANAERRTRGGFIGAGKLEDYSAGVVFRHEHTLSGPKADRLELLRHTRMHTGQLFMIYSDATRRVDAILAQAEAAAQPATEMRDEYGVVHRLWVISDPHHIAAIQHAMADQKLVIADGHHRYETALTYRNERRALAAKSAQPADPNASYERAMMTFVNTHSEGLLILPGHRVVSHLHDFSWQNVRRYLEPWFTTEEFSFKDAAEKTAATEKFLAQLTASTAQRAIGVYPEPRRATTGTAEQKGALAPEATSANSVGTFYLLKLRPEAKLAQLLPHVSALQRELDVVLLHDGILEPALGITPQAITAGKNLTFERDATAALAAVDSGAAQIAFLLNACDVEQVVRIATAGEVMPQKSTDFYPKLLSGITMYHLD